MEAEVPRGPSLVAVTELECIPPAAPEVAPAVESTTVQEPKPVVEVTEPTEAAAPVVEVCEPTEQPAAPIVVADIAAADVPEVSWLSDSCGASMLIIL